MSLLCPVGTRCPYKAQMAKTLVDSPFSQSASTFAYVNYCIFWCIDRPFMLTKSLQKINLDLYSCQKLRVYQNSTVFRVKKSTTNFAIFVLVMGGTAFLWCKYYRSKLNSGKNLIHLSLNPTYLLINNQGYKTKELRIKPG